MSGVEKDATLIQSQREEHVLIWTLDRPEALNAMNRPLLTALEREVESARRDGSIRCAILTGRGDRAFSAGADLRERRGMSLVEVEEYLRLIRRTFAAVASLPFPTIAALNGVAFGGGLELALACDLRLFAAEAEVGLTEVGVGIMPGAGGTVRLPRLIGAARAKELILSARRIAAPEALQMGLANAVVAGAVLPNVAREWAMRIAANAPLAVRAAKRAIDAAQDAELAAGLDIEAAAYATLLSTRDRLEGLAAFAEKRPPRYRGE